MKNEEIRKKIEESGLRYWQVAERYGCSDVSFSKKLRKEFSKEEKQKVLKIIKELVKEKMN